MTINVKALFRTKEIKAFQNGPHTHMAALEIVRPLMERINKESGQENDPDFMAYALEFLATRT